MEVMKKGHQNNPFVKDILNGQSAHEDLCYLVGYTWAEGNERMLFDSGHFAELVEEFLSKYALKVKESSEEILNTEYQPNLI